MTPRQWQWTGLVIGLVAFAGIWADVQWHGPLSAQDPHVYDTITAWQKQGFPANRVGDTLSEAVSVPWAVGITAIVTVWWWAIHERRLAAWAAGSGIVAGAAIYCLKESFQRELPPRAAGAWYKYSFPSGHTISATANVGLLFLLGAQLLVNRRNLAGARRSATWMWGILAWATWALLMGACRILSQRHWATDVVASWAIGLSLVCAVFLVSGYPRPAGSPAAPREPAVEGAA